MSQNCLFVSITLTVNTADMLGWSSYFREDKDESSELRIKTRINKNIFYLKKKKLIKNN